MDQEQLQQKIAEYFKQLPIDAQTMFASMEWMKTLENLSAKYNMTALQVQSLGTETTLLLLGIVHPDEYIKFLKADLSLSLDTQNKLMADINLGILNKWRETLTQAYNQNTMAVAEKEYGGEKKLDERFAGLPNEVQDAIANSNYQKELYIIANEEKLSIDQMGKLEKATNKIFLGIEHPDKYEEMLAVELELPMERAVSLASKVNERVLKNIRELLKSHADVHAEISVPLPPSQVPKVSTPMQAPVINSVPETKPIVSTPVVTVPMSTYNQPGTTPLPEYKFIPEPVIEPLVKVDANTKQTSMPETKIFGDSGIEMMNEVTQPANIPTTESVINNEEGMMKNSGVSIMESDTEVPLPPMKVTTDMEKDTLNGIENPTATKPVSMPVVNPVVQAPTNMIQDKLSKPVVNIQSATDQSLPKMSNRDPYREPVE